MLYWRYIHCLSTVRLAEGLFPSQLLRQVRSNLCLECLQSILNRSGVALHVAVNCIDVVVLDGCVVRSDLAIQVDASSALLLVLASTMDFITL